MLMDLIKMKVQRLKFDKHHQVYLILNNLHDNISDSEFGYRLQGLFAHTLIKYGMKILEIKAQGHPDIIGETENKQFKFEVETVIGKGRKRLIEKEDIEAIESQKKNEEGYIAILDYRFRPEWLLMEYRSLKWRISETLSIVTLKSLSDKNFSQKCTDYFFELILANDSRLLNLTFSILKEKALRGDEL